MLESVEGSTEQSAGFDEGVEMKGCAELGEGDALDELGRWDGLSRLLPGGDDTLLAAAVPQIPELCVLEEGTNGTFESSKELNLHRADCIIALRCDLGADLERFPASD